MGFRRRAVMALYTTGALLGAWACGPKNTAPRPGDANYDKTVTLFFSGLAALDAGDTNRADDKWRELTALAPNEAAVWANYGIVALRSSQLDVAQQRITKAAELQPKSGPILALLGAVEGRRGKSDAAIARYKEALQIESNSPRTQYALFGELDRTNSPEADEELQRLLEAHPTNLALLLETARRSAKANYSAKVDAALRALGAQAAGWPANCKEQWAKVQANRANLRMVTLHLQVLNNLLGPLPKRRADLALLKLDDKMVGTPIDQPFTFKLPPSDVAEPDMTLHYEPPAGAGKSVNCARSVRWKSDSAPAIVAAHDSGLQADGKSVPIPGAPQKASRHSLAIIDLDNDFEQDLASAGSSGLRLFKHGAAGLVDVTAATKLPPALLSQPLLGVWAVDYEPDSDLDLLVAPASGPAFVLQNNSDGTFKQVKLPGAPLIVRDLAVADLDGDGDTDLALVTSQGAVALLRNDRGGLYVPSLVSQANKSAAVCALDSDGDGLMEFAVLCQDGTLVAVREFNNPPVPLATGAGAYEPGTCGLFSQDFDNNGAPDLAVASKNGTVLMLASRQRAFAPVRAGDFEAFDAEDANGDGLMDLLISGGFVTGKGSKNYGWQVLRPMGMEAKDGDGRINSFGIGGQIEARAGLLALTMPIRSSQVHFGLGTHKELVVARIIWPTGQVQAEFDLAQNQSIAAKQRLDTSCPWVFAWNGDRMEFVTDFIWRSPLGMRINAQQTAGIGQTDDWILIRGDQLVPKDGVLDIRITAELNETHFFDYIGLRAVDHPEDVEVVVDERFTFAPLKLQFHAIRKPQPFASARDDLGVDVSSTVREKDGTYLDTFGLGKFQGVTRDHWVEVELPDSAPRSGRLVLLGQGWIHPTNSSINIALGQSGFPPPKALSLEALQPDGSWKVVEPNLGFPEGKEKTVVIDLDRAVGPVGPRRVRLRTNLEIYWDRLAWAERAPDAQLKETVLPAGSLDLRYRGFGQVQIPKKSAPEIPVYNPSYTNSQTWRNLEGFYTRYGDVRPLTNKIDDRYVIMNAGDEISLTFPALPDPPKGWKRDYALMGDGWVKDANFGTAYSATVLPLPYHGQKSYDVPPGKLEDDPAYRRNPGDWQVFHTRPIASEGVSRRLHLR